MAEKPVMNQQDSLYKNLNKLSDHLEDNPDPWFNDPKGYLLKPDFKRDAQKRSSIISGKGTSIFGRMMAPSFKRRYFVLSMRERKLRYYQDSDLVEEKGMIDFADIESVEYSHLQDAPANSLDLISDNLHYTLTCSDAEDMFKWALACTRCLTSHEEEDFDTAKDAIKFLPKYSRDSMQNRGDMNSEEKWHRFDFTYEKAGPMCMNVMGNANKDQYGKLLNSWVIVTAFELTAEGTPGPSEASGLISVKDYVVGVNGVDLTTSTFNEAMDTIGAASFPKTLHFLRDNEATKESTRIESWATVYYPALNRRRRRYCEVKGNLLNFRKPAPGGSASSTRDAFFLLDHIKKVVPVIDRNQSLESQQQFVVKIECKNDSTVEHVGGANQSVGGSPVTILELCFASEAVMHQWRSLLISPSLYNNNSGAPTAPVEIIEQGLSGLNFDSSSSSKDENTSLKKVLHTENLAIKSTLTGNLTKRDFYYHDGSIYWNRSKADTHAGSFTGKRHMFIANSEKCDLDKITAVSKDFGTLDGVQFTHALYLQAKESSLIVCYPSMEECSKWLQTLKETCAQVPDMIRPETLVFPAADTYTDTAGEEGEGDGDGASGSENNGQGEEQFFEVYSNHLPEEANANVDDTFEGYLYRRNDRLLPKGFSPGAAFSKVWVVIKDSYIFLFRSQIEMSSGVPPYMHIPLGSVYEVREATDAGVPENSFEVVTVEKVHTFSASDEDGMLVWVDALSDLLEARDTAVSSGSGSTGAAPNPGSDEWVKRIKDTILFSGGMTMKSVNLYTGVATWRDRFIVITRGGLSYYSDAKDVYNIEKASIGEVNLVGIQKICTSRETRCTDKCAFDVTAYVTKGGDEDGMRTFVFEARTPQLCKQWMEELCKATGKFDLTSGQEEGVYVSIATQKKQESIASLSGTNAVRRASVSQSGGRGGPGRGGGLTSGRGGAGRGEAFSAGKISNKDIVINEEPEKALNDLKDINDLVPIDYAAKANAALKPGGRGAAGTGRGAGGRGLGGRGLGGRGFVDRGASKVASVNVPVTEHL